MTLKMIKSEVMMFTFQISDKVLEQQLTDLLAQQFDGDIEAMMRELVQLYLTRLQRLNYSGIIHWPEDPLTYQKEVRGDWD